MKFNNRGFTLAQVLVAAGMLGALSLGFMQMMKNISDGQSRESASNDENELSNLIHIILNNEKFCRISLAGDGADGNPSSPVVFKKTNIDELGSEGLNVELFFSNQAGTLRTLKKISGTDTSFNKYEKIKIKSLKLVMNNDEGSNYTASSGHTDIGVLRLEYDKKNSISSYQAGKMDFNIQLRMKTDASGNTTILSCSGKDLSENTVYKYPESCSMKLSHRDNGGAFREATLDMSSGGYVGVRLRGDVNNDDDFRISASCSGSDELSSYFKSCRLGFGWKDSTDNGNISNANPTKISNVNFDGSWALINTDGDVNEDDSFYYRVQCPSGTNSALNEYVKSKCMICMGHTDNWYSSPEKQSCKKIQDLTDSSWGRIMTAGDVGADDALFLGFFCEGEHYNVIKEWSY